MVVKLSLEEQEPAPAEPSAGLDHIIAQAEALEVGQETAAAQAEDKAAELAIVSAEAELLEVLKSARDMGAAVLDWWPQYQATWSDQKLAAIAQAGAQIMARHGLTLGELFTAWGPYLALAVATIPPSLVTYAAIRQHNAEQAAQAEQAPRASRPGPPPMRAAEQAATLNEGVRL